MPKSSNNSPIDWSAINLRPAPTPAPVAPTPTPSAPSTPAATPTPAPTTFTTPSGAKVDASGNPISTPTPTTGADSFLTTLKEKLLGQAGAISSEDTNIEKKIKEAIGAVQTGNTASNMAIESAFGRQIDETKQANVDTMTSYNEAQRGFGVNTAAVAAITKASEKRVSDLEQRKQELILQGNAAAAGQVSGLIMKELEFEQDARMKHFSNLLNIGNFALNSLETEMKMNPNKALQSSDIETFTDTNGNVTAKNKLTGETLWTARVGRSGSASPNISVNPVADPVTGKVQYTQIRNNDNGTIKYLDNAGKEVDPSQVQIDKAADPIDMMISEVLNGISEGAI